MTAQIRILTDFTIPAPTVRLRNEITSLNTLRQLVSEWYRRIRERNELRELGSRDLADFMCSKADACAETSKWFWQA